jgi:pantetheine-phosphate adenylyltransferase
MDVKYLFSFNIIFKKLKKENPNIILDILFEKYLEKHRFFHTIKHIEDIFNLIQNEKNLTRDEKEILEIVAVFHDISYDPKCINNEENSINIFKKVCPVSNGYSDIIKEIILSTKTGESLSNLGKIFNMFDRNILTKNFEELLLYEKQIMKEYQYLDYSIYKQRRLEFLNAPLIYNSNLEQLINYIKCYKLKIGIYAGSFNPFHLGHYDILQKAEKIFDKVIIAKGINPEKENDDYKIDLPFHQIETFTGLLTEYAKSKSNVADYYIIKGLRNGYDLDYEFNQLRWMENLTKENINIVYIPCSNKYGHISSSGIRGLKKLNTNVSEFIFKWSN